jgi:hypothetical protein
MGPERGFEREFPKESQQSFGAKTRKRDQANGFAPVKRFDTQL